MRKQIAGDALRADFRAMHGYAGHPSFARILVVSLRHSGTLACLILRRQQVVAAKGRWKRANVLRSLNIFLTGADFAPGCNIGAGLRLLHPNGVVVGHAVVVGRDCTLMQQSTLGAANVDRGGVDGFPTLGDGVTVAAGARVLGPVTLGSYSVVGANAVVLSDVPPEHLAVGAPARVFPRREH